MTSVSWKSHSEKEIKTKDRCESGVSDGAVDKVEDRGFDFRLCHWD
jgi:hypothetical protein